MEVVIKGPDEYANIIEQQIALCTNRGAIGPINIELVRENDQLKLLERLTPALGKRTNKSLKQRSEHLLRHKIDVAQFLKQQKSWPAAKQKPLSQAIGRRTRTLIDATAGWGGDAMRFCSQGYQVICLERQPLFALMLGDAMQILARSAWAQKNSVPVPVVKCGEAINILDNREIEAECVYLDPMFPTKRKASAMANKSMELLHRLIGEDSDADSLLKKSVENYSRTVVKRPNYAPPLWREPDEQFSGKLIRYDVYFNQGVEKNV